MAVSNIPHSHLIGLRRKFVTLKGENASMTPMYIVLGKISFDSESNTDFRIPREKIPELSQEQRFLLDNRATIFRYKTRNGVWNWKRSSVTKYRVKLIQNQK